MSDHGIDAWRDKRMRRDYPVGLPVEVNPSYAVPEGFTSRMEDMPIEGFQIDEDLWGEGAESEIHLFLANEYDPATMPLLAAGDVKGREGVWLLGWENHGTRYDSMLVHIFGEAYAEERLDAIKLKAKQPVQYEGRFGLADHR